MRETIVASPVTAAVAGLSDHCHTHIHAAVDVSARLDPSLLQRALVEVAKAVPKLRGRFRPGFWRSRWDLDLNPRWRIEEHESVDFSSAQAIERELFARPFEPYGSLPLELEILHLSSHDRLLARVNHHLCDGGGTKNLLYRIAAAYGALQKNDSWTAKEEPFQQPHPLPRLLVATRSFSSWKLFRGIFRDVVSQLGGPFVSVPMVPSARGPNRFISVHIAPERVKRLKEVFSSSGITLNDMSLFALLKALEDFVAPNERRSRIMGIIATADFRLLLPGPQEDVSNLSVIGPLRFGKARPVSDDELLRAVCEETSTWKAGATGLGGALISLLGASIAPHGLTKWAFRKLVGLSVGRMGRRVALTNMGIIEEERLDFGTGPCLAARFTGPVGHPPQLIAALTGCRGGLDFNLTWREGALAPKIPERLIERFDSALQGLERREPTSRSEKSPLSSKFAWRRNS